jgi:very-short-patch-repair endonuclease
MDEKSKARTLLPCSLPKGRERGIGKKMRSEHRTQTSTGIQQRARELRQEMTRAEQLLWERLRNRQLAGLKFRRQHPLGPFITDFYCAEYRFVIEIDGDIHDFQEEQDEQRTRQFEEFGYRVIRFRNEEVESNIELVLKKIFEICQLPSPRIGRRAGYEGSQG